MKRDNQNGDDDIQNEGSNGGGGGGGGGGRPNKRFRGNDETIRLLIPSRVSNSRKSFIHKFKFSTLRFITPNTKNNNRKINFQSRINFHV